MPRSDSDSSDSSSVSSDDRRRRRDKEKKSKKSSRKDKDKKRDKSKKDKHDKDKSSKKDKDRKRDKRSRSPAAASKAAPRSLLSSGLQDFNVDAALEQEDREMFQAAFAQPRPGADQAAKEAMPGGGQLVAQFAAASSNALVAAFASAALIAPNAKTERIRSYANVARESRRVHVSHVPPGMDHSQLRQMFTVWCSQIRRQMIESETGKPLPDEAIVEVDQVVDVFLNTRGATPFAFIELTTDDMCTRLITGDLPVEFPLANGGTTRVGCRRPRDYKPMGTIDPSRIMLLGLAEPESMVDTYKMLFETVGTVTTFAVIPKRGFYVEFAKGSDGEKACSLLNGEVIGGRAVIAQPTTDAVRAWLLSLELPVTGILESDEGGLTGDVTKDVMGELLNFQINVHQALETFVTTQPHLKTSWPMILPTRILCIFNAFERAELDETSDSYDNLCEDIAEEVEKYGRVRRLIITKEPPKPPMPPEEYLPPKKPQPVPIADRAATWAADESFRPDEDALVDPSGLSDAQYKVELAMWEAEVEAGQQKYKQDYDDFLAARRQWDVDCTHPVFGIPGIGRCFVEYETVDEAENAQQHIAGRLFSGRTVVTSFLFEDVLYPPPDEEESGTEAAATNADPQQHDVPAPAAAAAAAVDEEPVAAAAADDID